MGQIWRRGRGFPAGGKKAGRCAIGAEIRMASQKAAASADTQGAGSQMQERLTMNTQITNALSDAN